MKPPVNLRHEFVEFIPDTLEDRVVYISIPYTTAVHKCVCGCGNQVVTPLSPTDWTLTFDGRTVSLDPSLGNWGFPCKSHYWVENDRAVWAPQKTPEQISTGRRRDKQRQREYFDGSAPTTATPTVVPPAKAPTSRAWRRIRKWFGGK